MWWLIGAVSWVAAGYIASGFLKASEMEPWQTKNAQYLEGSVQKPRLDEYDLDLGNVFFGWFFIILGLAALLLVFFGLFLLGQSRGFMGWNPFALIVEKIKMGVQSLKQRR